MCCIVPYVCVVTTVDGCVQLVMENMYNSYIASYHTFSEGTINLTRSATEEDLTLMKSINLTNSLNQVSSFLTKYLVQSTIYMYT